MDFHGWDDLSMVCDLFPLLFPSVLGLFKNQRDRSRKELKRGMAVDANHLHCKRTTYWGSEEESIYLYL